MSKFAITVTVKSNRFGEVARRLQEVASVAVRKAALDIMTYARMVAPVLTGNLKNSIQVMIESATSALVVVGAAYGIYVEFGTRYMGARPYFMPAVEFVAPQFEAALKSALGGMA